MEFLGMLGIQPAGWDSSSARAPTKLGPAPATRPQGHPCPPGTSGTAARLGGIWCQQVHRDVEILFYFPKLSPEHLPAIPLSREAAPELRGRCPRLPRPEEAAWGLGCAGSPETPAGRRGGKGSKEGKAKQLPARRRARTCLFPRDLFVLSGVSRAGDKHFLGGQAPTQGLPEFPQCCRPSPDSFRDVNQSVMSFDSSGRI